MTAGLYKRKKAVLSTIFLSTIVSSVIVGVYVFKIICDLMNTILNDPLSSCNRNDFTYLAEVYFEVGILLLAVLFGCINWCCTCRSKRPNCCTIVINFFLNGKRTSILFEFFEFFWIFNVNFRQACKLIPEKNINIHSLTNRVENISINYVHYYFHFQLKILR